MEVSDKGVVVHLTAETLRLWIDLVALSLLKKQKPRCAGAGGSHLKS
jgi:hypothetical protein